MEHFKAGMPNMPRELRPFSRSSLLIVLVLSVVHVLLSAASHPALAAEPEFNGACTMGLAGGKHIKTDCSTKWTAGDGKIYCFGSEDAKAEFLQDAEANLRKANENFASGDVKAVKDAMSQFTASDAQAFTEQHVKENASKNGGLFKMEDPVLARTIMLKFDKVEFVRTLHGYGFFPNVYFHDKDNPEKRYQIDFWLKPKDGKLSIVDVRIYKAPKKDGDKWIAFTRQPRPWWWIPASEHPGESEEKRGWEIMSAIHEHIAKNRKNSGGVYKLKDPKTGEMIEMDFVGIHQPVRRLKEDGRFFACSDFRKAGSKNQYYDVDFWLDENSGKIQVGGVRLHKVPEMRDGLFIQMPRYQFDPKTFEVVP